MHARWRIEFPWNPSVPKIARDHLASMQRQRAICPQLPSELRCSRDILLPRVQQKQIRTHKTCKFCTHTSMRAYTVYTCMQLCCNATKYMLLSRAENPCITSRCFVVFSLSFLNLFAMFFFSRFVFVCFARELFPKNCSRSSREHADSEQYARSFQAN